MFSVMSVCPSVRLSVCPSVCLSVCLSVCPSVQTITFETASHRNFIFGIGGTSWPYLGQVWVSRSLGQGQGHVQKNDYLLISTCYSFVCTFKAIKKVKVIYQGQGHTSRSRSNQGQHQIEVIFKERYSYACVVCIWIKCVLVMYVAISIFLNFVRNSFRLFYQFPALGVSKQLFILKIWKYSPTPSLGNISCQNIR